MLDIGYELKMRGAKNIFTCATFPLFTAGLDKFDKAYNDGIKMCIRDRQSAQLH